MPYQTKMAAKNTSIAVGLAMGLLSGWVVTILASVGMTFLISTEKIDTSGLTAGAVITVLLAALISALVAAGKVGHKRMIICLSSGGIYFLSLLCCNALFFDGTYQGIGAAVFTVIGASLVAGLMGLHQKKSKNRYLKRHNYH